LNNWLKIGLPVLIAVLLLISAVSITLAVSNSSRGNQLAASSATGTAPGSGIAKAYTCSSCPRYGQADSDDQAATGNPVYVPQGKQGSCCEGTTQGTASTQTFRGSCCGAR